MKIYGLSDSGQELLLFDGEGAFDATGATFTSYRIEGRAAVCYAYMHERISAQAQAWATGGGSGSIDPDPAPDPDPDPDPEPEPGNEVQVIPGSQWSGGTAAAHGTVQIYEYLPESEAPAYYFRLYSDNTLIPLERVEVASMNDLYPGQITHSPANTEFGPAWNVWIVAIPPEAIADGGGGLVCMRITP